LLHPSLKLLTAPPLGKDSNTLHHFTTLYHHCTEEEEEEMENAPEEEKERKKNLFRKAFTIKYFTCFKRTLFETQSMNGYSGKLIQESIL